MASLNLYVLGRGRTYVFVFLLLNKLNASLASLIYHWTAYQVNFGVLFHDALVFLWVIPVPAVTLPVIVQFKLYLTVFIWSYACACELCANFSGSLMR